MKEKLNSLIRFKSNNAAKTESSRIQWKHRKSPVLKRGVLHALSNGAQTPSAPWGERSVINSSFLETYLLLCLTNYSQSDTLIFPHDKKGVAVPSHTQSMPKLPKAVVNADFRVYWLVLLDCYNQHSTHTSSYTYRSKLPPVKIRMANNTALRPERHHAIPVWYTPADFDSFTCIPGGHVRERF